MQKLSALDALFVCNRSWCSSAISVMPWSSPDILSMIDSRDVNSAPDTALVCTRSSWCSATSVMQRLNNLRSLNERSYGSHAPDGLSVCTRSWCSSATSVMPLRVTMPESYWPRDLAATMTASMVDEKYENSAA